MVEQIIKGIHILIDRIEWEIVDPARVYADCFRVEDIFRVGFSNVIKLTNKFQKKEKKPLTKAKKCAARP